MVREKADIELKELNSCLDMLCELRDLYVKFDHQIMKSDLHMPSPDFEKCRNQLYVRIGRNSRRID